MHSPTSPDPAVKTFVNDELRRGKSVKGKTTCQPAM